MINIRNLTRAKENKEKFERLKEREKQALNTPLKSIATKENEKIIKIDKFIFTPFTNVESLDYELNLGISKVETLSKNYYLRIGGNEERISFEAKVFVEYLEHFNGFLDKVKRRVPLSFSTLESNVSRKIIIDKFSSKTKDWLMDSRRNVVYHTKEFSISGVLL